jgi:hypothetical protein
MKLNKKVFFMISGVAFVLILFAKIMINSMESFFVVSMIAGLGMIAVYYALCDAEGQLRNDSKRN